MKPILLKLVEFECWISTKWVSSAHKRLMRVQWNIGENPEFFDHTIDLYYQWKNRRTPFWVERGVFGTLALLKNGRVLEIACGDGFNTRHFYSAKAMNIVACDFDKSAIRTAVRKNSATNITYVLADVRTEMPDGVFDNIIFDAAIEHFTPTEISSILTNIKKRLIGGGY